MKALSFEDKIFSEFIRKRAIRLAGGCERCLTPKYDKTRDNGSIFPAWMQLQCSHFYGRRRKSVRWDPDNAAGLCAACHMHLTSNPQEHVDFFVGRLSEEDFERLQMRCLGVLNIDKNVLRIYLKQLLKQEDLYGK